MTRAYRVIGFGYLREKVGGGGYVYMCCSRSRSLIKTILILQRDREVVSCYPYNASGVFLLCLQQLATGLNI